MVHDGSTRTTEYIRVGRPTTRRARRWSAGANALANLPPYIALLILVLVCVYVLATTLFFSLSLYLNSATPFVFRPHARDAVSCYRDSLARRSKLQLMIHDSRLTTRDDRGYIVTVVIT